jgi:hypothetical protein
MLSTMRYLTLLVTLLWQLNVEHQYNIHGLLCTKVWGILVVSNTTVTVKCRTWIQHACCIDVLHLIVTAVLLTMMIPHTLVYNGPCMLHWCSTFNSHYNMHGPLYTKVWGILIVGNTTVTVKCITSIQHACMLHWCSTFNSHCSVTSNEDTSYLSV